MTIGYSGEWTLDINDGDFDTDEIDELMLIDEVGLGLPELRFKFMTTKDSLVEKYSEPRAKIKLGIGKTNVEESGNFEVFKKLGSDGAEGEGKKQRMIWAHLAQIDYLNKQRMEHYDDEDNLKKSSEVFQTVVGRYGLTAEVEETDDKMLWLQPNITDRKFLEDVVWHGYFGDGDPALSTLTRAGKAIYKPFSKIKTVKGTIGNNDQADYKSNYFDTHVNDGFMSAWGGSKRKIPQHWIEDGTDETIDVEVKQLILGTGMKEDSVRTMEAQFIGDNVHKNWHKALVQNQILRGSLSAVTLEFQFDKFVPLYPLDYVKVDWQKQDGGGSNQPIGGEWLVIGSRIIIARGTYQQVIKVSRERLLEG